MLSNNIFTIITNVTVDYNNSNCRTGNSNITLYMANSVSLYTPKDLDFLYIARSYPPCVIEVNLTDIVNPFVSKIFKIENYDS